MNSTRLSPGLYIVILLVIFFAISLIFRILLPYDHVFSGDWVKFTSVDAYYHMRLVDNLAHNFPSLTSFDPFFIYPGGKGVGGVLFFDWLLAGIIWVIGLGSPGQHTIDVISVYFPAILAALTIIPVFFIGKALFNKWAGVLAAALIAILPGEYMGRSILGFTDHHVAETLFSTVTVMFLILAIKEAGQRRLTLGHLIQRDRAVIVRPLVYSLLAGIFLGIYLITWQGGLLFVFIISLYLSVQFIIDHLRRKSTDHLGIAGAILFLVALVIFLPYSPVRYASLATVSALIWMLLLSGVSLLASRMKLKPVYYPVALIVIGVVFVGIFYASNPGTLRSMLSQFSIFAPTGAMATTTLEMQPFLFPQGSFSTQVAWGNFTTSFFLTQWWPIPGFALVSFFILIWLSIRQSSDGKRLWPFYVLTLVMLVAALALLRFSIITSVVLFIIFFIAFIWLSSRQPGEGQPLSLFLIWTLVIIVTTLAQRRFAYYLVINVALLSAYLSWQAIWLAGLRKLAVKSGERPEKEPHYPEVPQKRDYYEILGIARSASYKEIKKAYRELSSRYQPDRNRAPEAEQRFREINKAFEVLSNPGRRADYDRSRRGIPEGKKPKRREAGRGITMYHINVVLALIVVFIFVFAWNIEKSAEVAAQPRFAPSDGWQASLSWMKDNTPEPFGDPDAYYARYEVPPAGERFKYPESAYGVTSWWDYGYWITRTAQRLPSANPSQAAGPITKVANLFLSQDVSTPRKVMAELESSYMMIDYMTCTGKFWAVATWAEQDPAEYVGVYHMLYEGKLVPIQVFYPEYYRTLCVRLYNFDGKAVTDERPTVVSYDEKVDKDGNRYKQITDVQEFSSYKEALAYVESKSGNHSVVGSDPFASPISMEAVPDYQLIYSSEFGIFKPNKGLIPEVKIFEYTG